MCFYGFQCNSSAVCESLKGFFCDLQTAWRLVLSMKPWSYIWLEFGLFSTIIAIIRACACWALFVVTLTNTVHLIYIYMCVCIYMYIYIYKLPVYTAAPIALTHWDRVTHRCVGKLTIICSDNGLWPGFDRNSNIFIQEHVLENVVCQMASICLGLNVLKITKKPSDAPTAVIMAGRHINRLPNLETYFDIVFLFAWCIIFTVKTSIKICACVL